jgi:hypothetical protein
MNYSITSRELRCVACHQPLGQRHGAGCRFARFTISTPE